jgi:branched-chain amino acid transport system permease protein
VAEAQVSASFDASARLRAAVHPVTLLVVAALIVLPWVEPDKFTLHILSLIAIASIAAMGLQVLLGYSGQLSLGQAAFYGIGAYTSALLTAKLGVPFPLALIGAGVAAAIASLLMVPITRLTGAYLAVATLGFSIIVFLFIQNEEWLTGGSYGFIGIPRAELFGYALRDPMSSY